MLFIKFQEPIKPEHNIIKFCEDSGLPVALDETLDAIKGDFVNHLQKYAHPGIAAIVSTFSTSDFLVLILKSNFIIIGSNSLDLDMLVQTVCSDIEFSNCQYIKFLP